MGDKKKQPANAKDRRIEWMKLMKDIIDPLHDEIKEQTKQRQTSYRQILDHLVEACGRSDNRHYSAALKEAENYIKANCKWIALTEINKQCQMIETDVSFHTENKKWVGDNSDKAVGNVIYASNYCQMELTINSKKKEKELTRVETLKKKLGEVREMLAGYCGDGFELEAKEGTNNRITSNIKEDLVKEDEKLQRLAKEIVTKVGRVNNLPKK